VPALAIPRSVVAFAATPGVLYSLPPLLICPVLSAALTRFPSTQFTVPLLLIPAFLENVIVFAVFP
jgi:hypothetical protein